MVMPAPRIDYTCNYMERAKNVNPADTLLLVKVGKLWLDGAKFEQSKHNCGTFFDPIFDDNPRAGLCKGVTTTDDIGEAKNFNSFEKAVVAADYCGGKVVRMEPLEIKVDRSMWEPGSPIHYE